MSGARRALVVPSSRARALPRLCAAALVVGLLACGGPSRGEPPPDAWVEVRGQRIAVELAETPQDQALGLGERDSLAWDHGMYFVYDQPGFYSFWMKGMRFSIDIVWLREGRIIDISANVPYQEGGNGPTVRPRRPADGVLEVPAGYAIAKGWRIGDTLTLERVGAN